MTMSASCRKRTPAIYETEEDHYEVEKSVVSIQILVALYKNELPSGTIG
jgi:hypothetical protein